MGKISRGLLSDTLINMFGIFEGQEVKTELLDIEAFHKFVLREGTDILMNKIIMLDYLSLFPAKYYLNIKKWEQDGERLKKILETKKEKDLLKLIIREKMINTRQQESLQFIFNKNLIDITNLRNLLKITIESARYKLSYLTHKKLLSCAKYKIGKNLLIYHRDQIDKFVKEYYPLLYYRKDIIHFTSYRGYLTENEYYEIQKKQKKLKVPLLEVERKLLKEDENDLLARKHPVYNYGELEREDEESGETTPFEPDEISLDRMKELALKEENRRGFALFLTESLPKKLRPIYQDFHIKKKTQKQIANSRRIPTNTVTTYLTRIEEDFKKKPMQNKIFQIIKIKRRKKERKKNK